MYSYKDIVKEIISDIHLGKYKANDKLPSEQALTIKYAVSRIVASRVFSELRKIGAIYSVSKKGNFVATFFEGLIKPIPFQYDVNKSKNTEMDDYKPDTFKLYNIIGEFNTFGKVYSRDEKEIIWTENWLDKKIINNPDKNIVDLVMEQTEIVSSILISIFEKFNKNDLTNSLVTYRIMYSKDKIACVTRYKVIEEEFKIIKQEFSL